MLLSAAGWKAASQELGLQGKRHLFINPVLLLKRPEEDYQLQVNPLLGKGNLVFNLSHCFLLKVF